MPPQRGEMELTIMQHRDRMDVKMYNSKNDKLRNKKKTSLASEIDIFVGEKFQSGKGKRMILQGTWNKVAPPHVLEHTDAVIFDEKKEDSILIYVDSPQWSAELSMQREFYRMLFERELNCKIKEIRFMPSRSASQRKKWKN